MKYHNITKDDMLNGEGLRVVLWVSGCSHHCKGCQNPITWDPDKGITFDKDAKAEIFDQLGKDYIAGITLSGGDPLHEKNRIEIKALIKEVKEEFPTKTVWLYTGYTYEEILADVDLRSVMESGVDVLVEGKYHESERDVSLPWRGSSNQRVIRL